MLVSQAELPHGINPGIYLRRLNKNTIPLQEEHESRLERSISLDAWAQMDRMEKALVVASRRIRIAMKNLQAEEEIAKQERDARKK